MDKMCKVTNRSAGRVIYNIPEDHIRREFYNKETKEIALSELEKLAQQPGGRKLIYNYLSIQDADAIGHLVNRPIEPEYWLTEDKIPEWMNTCSLDEFKDALDFAPEGIKDLIKKYAVSLPLNDFAKRQALLEQLGFNVTKAIENSGEEGESAKIGKPAERRVIRNENAETQRRVVIKPE